MKNYILAIACLFTTAAASAATVTTTFDFGALANPEVGMPSIIFVQDGITVTASGTFDSNDIPYDGIVAPAYAYLDYDSNNNAGLGVCQTLVGTQCSPSSDDNVTYGETLILDFGEVVTIDQVTFKNGNHGDTFAGLIEITDFGNSYIVPLASVFDTTLSGSVFTFYNPNSGGDSDVSNNEQFYINTLTATASGRGLEPPAVPIPAAVWLFGSGLLGLVAVARRRT